MDTLGPKRNRALVRRLLASLVLILPSLAACSSSTMDEEKDESERPAELAPLAGAACGDGEVGGQAGDSVRDFSLRNQSGGWTRLSDYCGQVIVLQLGGMWCPTCQSEAERIKDIMEEYGSQGVIVLNLMGENPSFDEATVEDLKAWADALEIETPVLSDTDWRVWGHYYRRIVTPRAVLIDRQGRVVKNDFIISDADIEQHLQAE
jgi:peroxiredoxin